MNKNNFLHLASGAYLVYCAVVFYKGHKQEVQNRRAIIAQCDANIDAIWASVDVVMKKINNGEYIGKSLEDVQTDFEFYRIAQQEK